MSHRVEGVPALELLWHFLYLGINLSIAAPGISVNLLEETPDQHSTDITLLTLYDFSFHHSRRERSQSRSNNREIEMYWAHLRR